VAHDIRRVALTELIVLGLADTSGDKPAREDAAASLALAYAREARQASVSLLW